MVSCKMVVAWPDGTMGEIEDEFEAVPRVGEAIEYAENPFENAEGELNMVVSKVLYAMAENAHTVVLWTDVIVDFSTP